MKRKIRVRRLPYDRSPQSSFMTALQFPDGMIDVVDGNRGDADQSLRRGLAILNQPVIVDSKTGFLQARVIERKEIQHQRRVKNLRAEPIGLHLLDPGVWIPTAGMRLESFADFMRREERRLLAAFLRHPLLPKVGRLHDVRIRRDDD